MRTILGATAARERRLAQPADKLSARLAGSVKNADRRDIAFGKFGKIDDPVGSIRRVFCNPPAIWIIEMGTLATAKAGAQPQRATGLALRDDLREASWAAR